ncbi:MAG TPA: transketolase [Pirellulales bacterium]|jgi:transketolase|nr:transketolase [Pirellulales bacterium]
MHSAATATPATLNKQEITKLSIDTIRTLAMDAVEAAKSGHPGTPMALAPVAYTLWNEVLRYDPADPLWPGRDRFVLSCGHASMLLYATLHLAGVKQVEHGKVTDELAVPLEHIRKFRQLGFRTPGHPESLETGGVETTTGPLGQGVGNSVGMAIAQKWLASHFDRPGFELFDYRIYTLCSDGDLMEGVSNEAASIAGHLKLSNLCWIYDDNHITIEGNTELAYSDEVATRFTGLGWHVVRVEDANDLDALRRAYQAFHATTDKPTMVIVRSHIGYGAPHKQDTNKAHGEALGDEEIRLTKQFYGWPEDAKFLVPEPVLADYAAGVGARGAKLRGAWEQKFKQYAAQYPDLAAEWHLMTRRELPKGWESALPTFPADAKGISSRISSGKVLNAVAQQVPWLMGGAADLSPSTMTHMTFDSAGDFEPGNYAGRNFHFGIREHGMGAAVNGMALSYVRPFGSTFFVFTDYMRPSIRLSAIMQIPSIWIFTHDSIGVGEDGPTHEPIEHLAACRAIPNLIDMRPADANEVSEAWRVIMPLKDRPVCLVLTRQNLPTLDRAKYASAAGLAQGAYILADAPGGKPDVILMGTGSEVSLCVAAYETLKAEGVKARVVSMPSWALFEQQDAAYREKVLPASVTRRVACEAAERFGWDRYLGPTGRFVGMKGYGASAPGAVLFKHFGITAEHVASEARELLGKKA